MSEKTQATATASGFIHQNRFTLIPLFDNENYKIIEEIDLEAKTEDIEICYRDGSYDFIQVKTHEKPNSEKNKRFDSAKFKSAMYSLKREYDLAFNEGKIVNKLIYLNNMKNQKVETLNAFVKDGSFRNNIINKSLKELLEKEELESLEKHLDFKITDKFYIARGINEYFDESNLKYNALEALLETLKIKNYKPIFNELAVRLDTNSCKRGIKLNIDEVVFILIQHFFREDISENFQEDYKEELLDDVEEYLDKYDFGEYFENIIENLEVYQIYKKSEIEFKNIKMSRINNGMKKEFYEYLSKKFIEEDILPGIDDDDDKVVLNTYLAYKIDKKSKKMKRVLTEFKREEEWS